ncbi:metallophosphoesterase [Oceanobacillus sp. CAU 1775]
MNRRSFLKRAIGSFVGLIGLVGGTFFYGREIEPSSLQIRKEIIQSKKIPEQLHNKKIVQFSDTHLGFHYSIEDLEELVTEINNLSPDIIVFTGDLIDDPKYSNEEFEQAISQSLLKLDAPEGKYWIYGNHDHGGYGTDRLLEIMDNAGFTLLQNSHVEIHSNFIIAGIDDMMLGKPDLRAALANANPNSFTMLLAHEPDFADTAVQFPIDIQLSGHSHGGQVRLPILGHLYTPIYAEKYVLGKYRIENKLDLYVNAGIGTTRLPYRLFCRPEIHEYTLKAKMS